MLTMPLTTSMMMGNLAFAFIILKAPLTEEFSWLSVEAHSFAPATWLALPMALRSSRHSSTTLARCG